MPFIETYIGVQSICAAYWPGKGKRGRFSDPGAVPITGVCGRESADGIRDEKLSCSAVLNLTQKAGRRDEMKARR